MQGQVEGAPRADGGAREFRSLADEVRQQGDAAAASGERPSACPYRLETSQARALWLEGYLARAELMGRVEKHLAAALLQAVVIARRGDNVVAFGGGL